MRDTSDFKGRRRLPAEFFITMGCIVSAVAVLFFVTISAIDAATAKFVQEGTKANAQIDKLYIAGKGAHYIHYHYTDSGGLQHTDDDVYPFSDWSRFTVGQTIAVVYMASVPGHSRIARRQELMANRTSPAWICEYTALAGIGLLVIGWSMRRHRSSTR